MQQQINVIENLWAWGHFHRSRGGTPAMSQAESIAADFQHDDVQAAVRSYQETWADEINEQSKRFHGRASRFDGEWGPATAAVMANRFCNAPDYWYDDDCNLIEEANWPDSCRDSNGPQSP